MRASDYKGGIDRALRNQITETLMSWAESCFEYLRSDNWIFKVGPKGEYLPGEVWFVERPGDFEMQVTDSWRLTLRAPASVRNQKELDLERGRFHKAITGVLMKLSGVAGANKLLKDLRDDHKLMKLKEPDVCDDEVLL